jgi:hypothetical protein
MLGTWLQETAAPRAPGGAPKDGLAIRPEVFFFPPWRGRGLICDAFGIPSEAYDLHGQGRIDTDGAVVIEHVAEFDSGLVNTFQWKMAPAQGDLVLGRDVATGTEARGRMTAQGFRWTFLAMTRTAFGLRRCRAEIVYRMVNPHETSSSITCTFLGVTVATGSAHIHHVANADTRTG